MEFIFKADLSDLWVAFALFNCWIMCEELTADVGYLFRDGRNTPDNGPAFRSADRAHQLKLRRTVED